MVKTQGTLGTDAMKSTAINRRSKIAGLLLIASPVLWLVGAVVFMPQIGEFYNEGDSLTKLAALTGQQVAWTLQSLLFFAGTLAAMIGLVVLSGILGRTHAASLARSGMVGIVAVAAVYTFILVLRLTAPTDGVLEAVEGSSLLLAAHFSWLGIIGMGLTLITVTVYGVALFLTGRAKMTGGLVAVLSTLAFVAILIGGPLPPVIVYPIAAVLGVRLLFWDTSSTR
jgi:hypothetical protein